MPEPRMPWPGEMEALKAAISAGAGNWVEVIAAAYPHIASATRAEVAATDTEGAAMDWLLDWVSAQDRRVPSLYFKICDGEITVDEAEAAL